MNITAVADTHAVIWYLYDDKRLSQTAGTFIDEATQKGYKIAISPITFVEAVYLTEKHRIEQDALTRLALILQNPLGVFIEIPLNIEVAKAVRKVQWEEIPDLPDRIIAATAVYLNVPIISRDNAIRISVLDTIW